MSRKCQPRMSAAVVALACCALAGAAPSAAAQEMSLQLDPARTRVQFTLSDILHTVHGSFRLKSGSIQFDPTTGAASGAIVVDATSGDSGNRGRDRKMNKDVLESAKYPEITFLPRGVIGAPALHGASQVQVQGIFRLHGADHELTMVMPLQASGSEMEAQSHFVVPYQAWGLRNPSTLFLRVGNQVAIDIDAVGRLAPVTSARR